MSVNTQHAQYIAMSSFWQRMRDSVGGEDQIKNRGEAYLPIPPGIGKTAQSPEYINYKARARYPEAVAPAVEGMVGLMGRKLKEPVLPDGLKYLIEEATPDGLTLADLINRLRHEVNTVGRHVLFVDVPEDGGNPYIASYAAESVINWRCDGDKLTMVVFYEQVEEVDPVDPFETKYISQWRVAEIENGLYVVRIWRQVEDKDDSEFYIYDETFPTQKGDTLDYVPAVFIGSRDLTPEPDAIPLLGVANKSLHYYRQYADYAMQLFMSANGTTPYLFGSGKSPGVIGPTEIWHSEDPNTKAGYIEVTGAGLGAQEKELTKIDKEIDYATMRVLGDKKAAEAAETLRLRFQSQTATLVSISKATSAGLKLTLKYCADWMEIDSDGIEVPAEAEFISEQPDAQIITALYDGIERGLTPDNILIEYLRKIELHDSDPEEYRRWAAALMAEGSGEE